MFKPKESQSQTSSLEEPTTSTETVEHQLLENFSESDSSEKMETEKGNSPAWNQEPPVPEQIEPLGKVFSRMENI